MLKSFLNDINSIMSDATIIIRLSGETKTPVSVIRAVVSDNLALKAVGMSDDEIRIIQRLYAMGKLDIHKLDRDTEKRDEQE